MFVNATFHNVIITAGQQYIIIIIITIMPDYMF